MISFFKTKVGYFLFYKNKSLAKDTVELKQLLDRLAKAEAENKSLRTKLTQQEVRLGNLEKSKPNVVPAAKPAPATAAPAKPAAKKEDDFDLFDDDEEDSEEKQRIKEERLKQYADKKAGKKEVIAKSSILLDVKPWDDETDMKALEAAVRGITIDGLIWGQSKLIPVAYGVKKLQITCVIVQLMHILMFTFIMYNQTYKLEF